MIKNFLKRQTDYSVEGSVAWKTRNKRMKVFNEFFEDVVLRDYSNSMQKIKIIDVGGVPRYWKYLDFKYMDRVSITCLNLEISDVPEELKGIIISVKGTAIDMSEYDDQSFDLSFSNSVIEHVGDYGNQKKMADEMKRIARHGFIQTPNRFFFMEPHFLFPLFQFLPITIREKLVCRFSLGHFSKANTLTEAKEIVESVHLLSARQLSELFSDADLICEKWMNMTKSYILRW